jgi:WD40 repeat protein
LVHRDIKPENMLVETANDILLSDFGIAIIAHKTQSLSTQEAIGTITYMAPEQIKGKARPASDQYSLGVAIYEWLCGVCPFEGTTSIEVAMSHLTDPPPSLRAKVPALPVEVEQVVLKALAKDPQQRFASVQAFAQAFTQACRPAKSTVRVALPLSQSPALALPSTEYVQSSPPASALPPTVSVSFSPPASTLLPTQRASVSPPPGTPLFTYRGHSKGVRTTAWSPDGTRIASGSRDKTVQIWDAVTGQLWLTYCGHSKGVSALAWSPDGRRIASGSQDKTVQVWDTTTGNTLCTYRGHTGFMSIMESVAWSPDGKCIASAGVDRTVQVWDATTGTTLYTYCGHTGLMSTVESVAWSPDSNRIASGSRDKTVQVWQAPDSEESATLKGAF